MCTREGGRSVPGVQTTRVSPNGEDALFWTVKGVSAPQSPSPDRQAHSDKGHAYAREKGLSVDCFWDGLDVDCLDPAHGHQVNVP